MEHFTSSTVDHSTHERWSIPTFQWWSMLNLPPAFDWTLETEGGSNEVLMDPKNNQIGGTSCKFLLRHKVLQKNLKWHSFALNIAWGQEGEALYHGWCYADLSFPLEWERGIVKFHCTWLTIVLVWRQLKHCHENRNPTAAQPVCNYRFWIYMYTCVYVDLASSTLNYQSMLLVWSNYVWKPSIVKLLIFVRLQQHSVILWVHQTAAIVRPNAEQKEATLTAWKGWWRNVSANFKAEFAFTLASYSRLFLNFFISNSL